MSNLLGLEEERPEIAGSQNDAAFGPALDPEWTIRVKRGANWFYWIAGLSVINSAAFVIGSKFHFLAGLGLTELADSVIDVSIRQGAPAAIRVFSVVFDLILVIGFALTGYFANKVFKTAFIVGIIVYVFDALIVLLLGSFLMAGFHAFALFFIIRGFLACRELRSFEKASAIASTPPPPPAFA